MKRSIVVLVAVLFFFASLPVRMIYLVLNTENFPDVSNSTRSMVISELRGEIYDCNNKPLVNRKSENAVIVLPYEETAKILKNHLDSEEYVSLLKSIENCTPFLFSGDCETESDFVKITKRYNRYTNDGFCCHVVGYINAVDNEGIYGIEKSFDGLLKEDSRRLLFRYNTTAFNEMLAGGESELVPENYYSKKGVKLTIDSEIQRIAENAMRLYEVERGAVVVLDSENGEIRAMASAPKFDQTNVAESLKSENSPLLNRAVNAYSVGSVFKLVVAAAAIESGNENFESYCEGSLELSGRTFSCSNALSHGQMTLEKAFAHSCNTYFIRLALEMGSNKILETAENLGVGKSFSLAEGIYSSSGNLPDESDVVTDGMLANISFGQGGLLATPLQIASCYCTAVNGGTYISPKLVLATVNSDGTEVQSKVKQYKYRAFSEEEAGKLKGLLVNNFNEGTCVPAKPANCIAGGKTSTAETGWIDENGEEILYSWFAGFAECGDKLYTITVFKENGVSGSKDCGPVFKEISQRIAEIKCE